MPVGASSRRQYINLQMPYNGIVKKTEFQKSPPFTTYDAQNVIPYESVDGRRRLGSRPGLAYDGSDTGGDVRMLARMEYIDTSDNSLEDRLIQIGEDGQIYKSTSNGGTTFSANNSGDLRFATDHHLMSVWRNGLMYIADYDLTGPKAFGTNGTVTGTSFDSTTYGNWATIGINKDDYVVVIDSASEDGAAVGVYEINLVASGAITLASSPGNDTNITFRVVRCPKIYDPNAGIVTRHIASADKGGVPCGHPCIALFRDKIWYAGGPDAPHNVHGSKSGDPLDWDISATDNLRAISISGVQAGQIMEPVTALISHADQCLIIGCRDSLHIMRGDPAFGGQIDTLSFEIGIVDKKAWCQTPNNETVFLSRDGVYMCPRECGASGVTSISRETVPEELLNVSYSSNTVLMEYDLRLRGVYITRTPASGTGEHWFLSWWKDAKGFWKMTFQADHQPTAMCVYPSRYSDNDSPVMWGGRDGKTRQFSLDTSQDDGSNAITSYVFVGPVNIGGIGDAMVTELQAITDTSSGDVDWELRTGQSAEQALNATARFTGQWNFAGRNSVDRPRARGSAFALKLTNGETNAKWALDAVSVAYEQFGFMRAYN